MRKVTLTFLAITATILISQCGKKEKEESLISPDIEKIAKEEKIDIITTLPISEQTWQNILTMIRETPPPEKISFKKLNAEIIQKLNPIPAEKGGAFKSKDGDILVETDKIRVVIQSPSREIGPFTYGGNIIDADIKRENEFHDVLGEENLFLFLGHTLKPQKVGIYMDNVFVATGELDILDYINANGLIYLIKNFIPTFEMRFKIDEEKPIDATKIFVFSNGRYVRVIDVVCNRSQEDIPQFFFADMIDSGGDGDFFIPTSSLKGFGYKTPALLGLGLFSANMLGFVSEKIDSSYAIFPENENNIAFIVSGVAVLAYNLLEGDPLNSLISVLLGNSERLQVIKAGECLTNSKFFVIGDGSASSLTDEFFRIKKEVLGDPMGIYELSGKVSWEGSGESVIGKVRVAIFQNENLITTVTTNEYGNFKVTLPEGQYKFIADLPYTLRSDPITVNVPSEQKIELKLTEPAKVYIEALEVIDTNGQTSTRHIPAKVSFVCIEECPKRTCVDPKNCDILSTSFRDEVYDPLPDGVQEVVFLAKGERTEVKIPPGKYRVVVSRGMEYSRYEDEITVGSGDGKSITAYLHKVADATGWLSADTHVHAVNSPDSPVSLIDRAITFGAEGVDIIISTDHDWLTDYEPAIKLLGLSEFLASLVGQEITTFSYGHFNAYPLQRKEAVSNDGAFDWSEKYDRYEIYGISEGEKEKYRFLRSLHPREIFKGAHLLKPQNIKRNIVQVNHPRSGGMGYFDAILLDTVKLTTAQDPCVHRIFPPLGNCGDAKTIGKETELFIPPNILKDIGNPERFDAIEVYNSYYEIPKVLNDWFTFLNHGIHITAVGVSDTHQKIAVQAGIGRTFVKVREGKDLPQKFRNDIEVIEEFIDSILNGRVFVSNGIILEEFQVCGLFGQQDKCVDMGLNNMGILTSNFVVKIKVKSADWIDFDTIKIFINTRNTGAKEGMQVNNPPTPAVELTSIPSLSEKKAGGLTFKYRELSTLIPINPPGEDFWVVAVVECSKEKCEGDKNPMFPVITDKKVRPILITNPVYIDMNGDGKFSPTQPSYGKGAPRITKEKIQTDQRAPKITPEKFKEYLKKALEAQETHTH